MKLTSMKVIAVIVALLFGLCTVPTAFAKSHHSRNRIDRRQQHQMQRINQGEKSGALTKGEAKGLKKDEKAIRTEKRRERKENGGKLTAKERKEVNQQLNQESKKIREEKHNAAEKPPAK